MNTSYGILSDSFLKGHFSNRELNEIFKNTYKNSTNFSFPRDYIVRKTITDFISIFKIPLFLPVAILET